MVGFIHQAAVTNPMHLQSTYTSHLQYLQSEAHLESRRLSVAKLFVEIVNVLRPLPILAEELYLVSLRRCLTGF